MGQHAPPPQKKKNRRKKNSQSRESSGAKKLNGLVHSLHAGDPDLISHTTRTTLGKVQGLAPESCQVWSENKNLQIYHLQVQ